MCWCAVKKLLTHSLSPNLKQTTPLIIPGYFVYTAKPWRVEFFIECKQHSLRALHIIIIIRTHRRQRSVASTHSRCVHNGEPWTIRHECQKVCRRRFVEATSCVGDLFTGANREGRSQFGLPRPVTMHNCTAQPTKNAIGNQITKIKLRTL